MILSTEQSLIACLFLNNAAISGVAGMVSPECFTDGRNRLIFESILHVHRTGRRGVDLVSVADHLASLGKLEECGGPSHLLELVESIRHGGDVMRFAAAVQKVKLDL